VGNHDYHKLVLCGTGTRIPEYGVKEGRKGTRKKEKRKKEKKGKKKKKKVKVR